MQEKSLTLLILCALVLLFGTAPQHPSHAQTSQFEAAECAFYVPFNLNVDCGYLSVPEDRSDPNSAMIRLHVAIFRSLSAEPLPDPVVYIPDGPGSYQTSLMQQRVTVDYAAYLDKRDFIVMDLRGVGYSEPSLDCRAFDRLVLGTIEAQLTADEVVAQQVEAIDSCYQEYAAAGVKFAGYTTSASAADLRDLRTALGYEVWNVHSIGYGTRVALELMQADAEGLRSMVLDSPIAPQADVVADGPLAMQYGLDTLFARCKDDPECSVGYPDLETRVYDAVAQLNAEPATLSIAHPFTQQPYAMVLDGNRYIQTLMQAMELTANLQFMPLVMDTTSYGNFGFIKLLVDQSLLLTTYTSEVTQVVQLCMESATDATTVEATLAQTRTEIRDYLSIQPRVVLELCQRWGLPQHEAPMPSTIEAAIPTLILAGEYDGATMGTNAEVLGALVPNAYRYTFAGVGHDVLLALEVCPLVTIVGFIENPLVDPIPDCYATQDGVTFVSREDMLEMQRQMQGQ